MSVGSLPEAGACNQAGLSAGTQQPTEEPIYVDAWLRLGERPTYSKREVTEFANKR